MFARFTTPEGMPMLIRAARVQAITRTEEGHTRVFLSGSLSCLVAEDEEEVLRRLVGGEDEDAMAR